MYITNKHISRRTVLKGVGATVALPPGLAASLR